MSYSQVDILGFEFTDYSQLNIRGSMAQISEEKSFSLNLSGNKGNCTNALLLPVKVMLCSELHFQIFLVQFSFHMGSVNFSHLECRLLALLQNRILLDENGPP